MVSQTPSAWMHEEWGAICHAEIRITVTESGDRLLFNGGSRQDKLKRVWMAIQLFCPRYDVADACYNVRNNSVVYAAHHVPLQCSCENLVHRHVNTVVYEYAHTMYNECSSKSKRIYSLFFQRTEICFAHSLWMEETETKKDFSFIPVSEFPPPGSHLNKPHFHYEQRGGENSLYVSLSLSLSLSLSPKGRRRDEIKGPKVAEMS